MSDVPKVLVPFDAREACSLREAADIAGCGLETMRRHAALKDLGRRVMGQWRVSRVALAMALDGNGEALARYLDGDRSSAAVRGYYRRLGLMEGNR